MYLVYQALQDSPPHSLFAQGSMQPAVYFFLIFVSSRSCFFIFLFFFFVRVDTVRKFPVKPGALMPALAHCKVLSLLALIVQRYKCWHLRRCVKSMPTTLSSLLWRSRLSNLEQSRPSLHSLYYACLPSPNGATRSPLLRRWKLSALSSNLE